MMKRVLKCIQFVIKKLGTDEYLRIIKNSYNIVFGVFSFVAIFFSVDDYIGDAIKIKIFLILALLFIPVMTGYFIGNVKEKYVKKNRKSIKNGEFIIEYGDLHKLMFPTSEPSNEYTVVIPVNNRLNEVATRWKGSKGTSNHGFWLNTIIDKEYIREQDLQNLCIDKLKAMNLYRKTKDYEYPVGTCILLRGNEIGQVNVNIILAATGGMTKEKRAYSTEEQFIAGIQGIINTQITHLYTIPLYLPLISGGFAGVDLKKEKEALIDMMYRIFKFNEEKLRANIHIIVYEKEKNKPSIFI